jgi:N-acetyl-gamma-glutamyl-phosphate reductase
LTSPGGYDDNAVMSLKAAIIGASGYTGMELLRLVAAHPELRLEAAVARSHAGKRVRDVCPHLGSFGDLAFADWSSAEARIKNCEVVFSALPHGESMGLLAGLENSLVVDLGADFRLSDAREYEEWYRFTHTAPDELGRWVYGLPELFREQIARSRRIANPGCYATAIILAAAPFLKAGVIGSDLAVCAVSGVSGAGRKEAVAYNFSEIAEGVAAYKIGRHQHTPEIEMALRTFSGRETRVTLVPQLAPLIRGIHATTIAPLSRTLTQPEALALLREAYGGEPFVDVMDGPVNTKWVRGSNRAALSVVVDPRVERLIIVSAIDNLVKGAAGQAVQNANLALGLPETAGLESRAVYP